MSNINSLKKWKRKISLEEVTELSANSGPRSSSPRFAQITNIPTSPPNIRDIVLSFHRAVDKKMGTKIICSKYSKKEFNNARFILFNTR